MTRVIPLLPCKVLDDLLHFYRQLGFEVTYHQKSPNPYAVTELGDIRLDFYGIKHHDPAKCYHTCYILTDDADQLHEQFSNAMRKKSGKLPTRGLPRISDIRNKAGGIREFMFSDIAGNCIRIGRKISFADEPDYSPEVSAASRRLALALDFAYKSEDTADEFETVLPMLDKAIDKEKNHPCLNLYKVMILRADMAIAQRNFRLASELLHQVKHSDFISSDQQRYRSELKRVEDLEELIKHT